MDTRTLRQLPESLLAAALGKLAEQDPVLQRRVTLMALLWEPGQQTQAGLVARAKARLGQGCFGRQPGLAFRRDMQFVKAALARSGYGLKYSRRAQHPGYVLQGQTAEPGPHAAAIARDIVGAARELDPAQIAIWARLTPAARMRLANTLTRDVLSLAVTAQRQTRPEQSKAEAQQEVLHRYYQATPV